MNSNGGFHEEENDGTLSLVYHHSIFKPIPQTQSPTSCEASSDDNSILQPLFLCPNRRRERKIHVNLLKKSSEYIGSTTSDEDDVHSVVPLFWCNNKEADANHRCCDACKDTTFGEGYFFCVKCNCKFHKECVQSPSIIKHPYHPEHPLQLSYHYEAWSRTKNWCLCCQRIATDLVYFCIRCDVLMHTICAMKSLPFVVDKPKSHHHPLTLFPKQASLTCNVCGLICKYYPTYVCLKCSFIAHNDCMDAPRVIKISRHHHRISYIFPLQSQKFSCGVCRKSMDGDYGAYICDKCSDYAVHTKCALRKDVWDGIELEGIPEEDNISLDAKAFETISEGLILHFLHEHHLQLEFNILYDERNICEACVMPIDESNFYSCTESECEFILHETCAKSPRRIQHALHPHPLILKSGSRYASNAFSCTACTRTCGGFVYECRIGKCDFDLDVRCASISEPFVFQGHEHPLFLALPLGANPRCDVCRTKCYKQFNCIECDFIVCFKCSTLPHNAKYKHDKHMLTLLWGEEVCEKDWCELCERNLGDTRATSFYWCKDCCTSLHINCLFDDALVKPCHIFRVRGIKFTVLRKNSLSRPLCDFCKCSSQGRMYSTDKGLMCSWKCAWDFSQRRLESSK